VKSVFKGSEEEAEEEEVGGGGQGSAVVWCQEQKASRSSATEVEKIRRPRRLLGLETGGS
jgi:hypothetical protein